MKKIPDPIDAVGRAVSFKTSPTSIRLEGEVVKVGFKWPYPKDDRGLPRLCKQITVLLPDGRVLNMDCEKKDIKRYDSRAEDKQEDYGW